MVFTLSALEIFRRKRIAPTRQPVRVVPLAVATLNSHLSITEPPEILFAALSGFAWVPTTPPAR